VIVALGIGGHLLTSTVIHRDRDAAAERRALVKAIQTQEVLSRARAYVAGLADLLATEPVPSQGRFRRWVAGASAGVGLDDVLWVRWAPGTRSHLAATLTSSTREELRPGMDAAGIAALGDALRDRAAIFAVGASTASRLGHEPGFFLLTAAEFRDGAERQGVLVAFVPRGWFSTSLGGDPRGVAIRLDGTPSKAPSTRRTGTRASRCWAAGGTSRSGSRPGPSCRRCSHGSRSDGRPPPR